MFRLVVMAPVFASALVLSFCLMAFIPIASASDTPSVATNTAPVAPFLETQSATYALKPFVGFGGSVGRGQYYLNDDGLSGRVPMKAMWSYDFRAGSYYDTIGTAIYLSYLNTKGHAVRNDISYDTIQNALYVAGNFNIITRYTYLIAGLGRVFNDASLSHMLGFGIHLPFGKNASIQAEYVNYVDVFSNVARYQSDSRNVFRMGITYFPSMPRKAS